VEKILTILGVIAIAALLLLEGYNKYLDIEAKLRLMPKEEVVVQHHVYTERTITANDTIEKSYVVEKKIHCFNSNNS